MNEQRERLDGKQKSLPLVWFDDIKREYVYAEDPEEKVQ